MIEFNLEAKLAQEEKRKEYEEALEMLKKEFDVKYQFMSSKTSSFSKIYNAYTIKISDDISTN